ncbi:Zinc finger C2HC domain-containing protein 1B [Eumeta japonica]|uniref:Zinc finger C2HC domain-containing protein 1B n=1 Tax=Eumeta variegata TaxID=151549 RepID=A0A4C1X5B2_EUMVA|nr:Zinc finger C2HC domain-containing protein 1B [Eumeta japonica]
MFEERRSKGIDKSYPLKPINNNTLSRQVNGHAKTTVTASSKVSVSEKKTVKSNFSSHSLVRKQKIDNMFDASADLNHNLRASSDVAHADPPGAKCENEGPDETDGYRLEDETFPEALAPAQTPRDTPPPALLKKNPAKVNGVVTTKAQATPAPRRPAPAPAAAPAASTTRDRTPTPKIYFIPYSLSSRASSGRRDEGGAAGADWAAGADSASAACRCHYCISQSVGSASSLKAKPAGPRTAARAAASAPAEGAGVGEGAPCAVCGRRFAPDRLDKHQSICKKARAKKRKPFDALKHRLAGTEAEPFIMKARRSGAAAGTGGAGTGAVAAGGKVGNSNWRQKHEDFIRAIRAAKQVQAHLNAGVFRSAFRQAERAAAAAALREPRLRGVPELQAALQPRRRRPPHPQVRHLPVQQAQGAARPAPVTPAAAPARRPFEATSSRSTARLRLKVDDVQNKTGRAWAVRLSSTPCEFISEKKNYIDSLRGPVCPDVARLLTDILTSAKGEAPESRRAYDYACDPITPLKFRFALVLEESDDAGRCEWLPSIARRQSDAVAPCERTIAVSSSRAPAQAHEPLQRWIIVNVNAYVIRGALKFC